MANEFNNNKNNEINGDTVQSNLNKLKKVAGTYNKKK